MHYCCEDPVKGLLRVCLKRSAQELLTPMTSSWQFQPSHKITLVTSCLLCFSENKTSTTCRPLFHQWATCVPFNWYFNLFVVRCAVILWLKLREQFKDLKQNKASASNISSCKAYQTQKCGWFSSTQKQNEDTQMVSACPLQREKQGWLQVTNNYPGPL